ncbi:glycosyltransferase family 2 protein [Enterobacter kobei]|uniref:glycosyltransferase family 2 protein n=1 Tax=Enterobacter kobei TaxID=208224 RepID=UPI0020052EE8|nr:glycosyltransferase [Enterobacter kobei]MCK7154287.1 glycosyltransferase [Enterobacter kobei]MCK7214781.1 glycosyltransferase [Enterobacter kobei]HCM9091099.1 glycosyltransferase [Enterobacter kobei]HCM9165926.1 glycosyltransferase [Enterobacter kobei]HDZ8317475.1 glycosyltransferase [Enterobacter kobei]
MTGEILISVCCITYNQENYIDDCISSILQQKLPYNYEIIVGDDCSSDTTREKLKLWSLKFPGKITIIYNEKNLGPNGNILSVFKKAKGEYIAFCEGDDYWIDEYKLLKQYNALTRHPEAGFCFHSAYMEQCNKRLKSFSLGNVERKFYTKDVLQVVGQFAPTASYMFKSDIINKLPFWFTECCVGDLFLELYSMKNGGVYLPEPMSVYRVNTVGSWSEAIRNDIIKFTERHLNIAKHLELAKYDFEGCVNAFNKKIANVYLNMCTRFLFEKDYMSFRIYLEKANFVNVNFTAKQKFYNKFKSVPQIIFLIHYLKSFMRN